MRGWPALLLVCLALTGCGSGDGDEGAAQDSGQSKVSGQARLLPRLIDLGSKSCIPCKQMAPILDSLRVVYQGQAEIVFIDIREDKQAVAKYHVVLIPTQVFIDSRGIEVYRHIGFFPADSIEYHLRQIGAEL